MNRLFLLLLLLSCFGWAQEKIYIDNSGNPVSQDKASLYRTISEKQGIYHIKDFYLNGKLQMDAFSKNKDFRGIEELVGKFTFYLENGKIEIQGEEKKGELKYKMFDEKGRITTLYSKDAKDNEISQSYYYPEEKDNFNIVYFQENGEIKKIVLFDKDLSKIRIERFNQDNGNILSHYYDERGKLIGSRLTKDDDSPAEGTEVEYYFNPAQVRMITQWDNKGNITTKKEFYRSGKVFSERTVRQKDTIITFLNPKQKKMGELLIKEGHPYQGVAYNLDESGVLQGKEDYKLGILSESTFFYKNGNIKQKVDNDIHGSISKITYFNKNKSQKGIVSFRNETPYEGYLYDNLEKNESYVFYKEGEINEIKQLDDTNRLRFYKKVQENGEEVGDIYNKKGEKEFHYIIKKEKDKDRYDIKTTISFKQFKNGKEIHSGVIKDGILSQGSIRLNNRYYENADYIYKIVDNKIVKDHFYKDKIFKTEILYLDYKKEEDSVFHPYLDGFEISEEDFQPYMNNPTFYQPIMESSNRY